MKNKVKYVKSLVIVSIIISLVAIGWGVYELTNNEFLIGLGFISAGVVMIWNDLNNLLNPDPLRSFLSAYWSELLNQINKAKSNNHKDLSPTYYLYFKTYGCEYGTVWHNKGRLIDPLGNVYSYDYSKEKSEVFNFKNSFEDSELKQFYFEMEEVHQLTQEISREDLLKVLSICKKEKNNEKIEINLKQVIRNVKRYGYNPRLNYPDAPEDFSYVLIYDENKDVYKRIITDRIKTSFVSKFISKFKLNKLFLYC